MKKLIYFLTLLILISCGSSNIPDDVKYEITKEEPYDGLKKDNIEVQLNKKVDEKVLKEIAFEIQKSRKQYDNLWIFYYIPDMTPGMAWATTHFTPELKVEIIGSTESQDVKTSNTDNIKGEIIGKWRSEKSLMGATLILYKNPENKLTIRITFKDGTNTESEIKKSQKNGKTRYDDNNEHGEYYILESNGNLGMYGTNGKFDEAVKIE